MAKNIWKDLELKIVLIIILIAVALSFTIYLVVYDHYYSLTIDKLKEDAIIIHNYAEDVIDKRTFFELNTIEDEQSGLYLSTHSHLDEIRRIANIMYLYTAKRTEDGRYIYVVDGLSRDAEDFRHVGDPIEEEIIPQLSQSLNDEVVFGDRILNTEWGIVYVVYFPFHDSAGSVIGAIGMEFDCEYLLASFSRMRIITIVVSLILLIVFITISYFAIKKLVSNAKITFMKMEVERNEIERDMRKVEERTKLMLDSSPICTQIWDKDMNTVDCNEAAVKLYGFKDKQEYIERFIRDCSPEFQPDGRRSDEMALSIVKEAFDVGQWNGEWLHRIPGEGVLMPSEVTLVRVNYEGDYAVAGYTRDMRKENEQQKALKESVSKEQEASRAKSIFLAKMSHEIRTPMNAIIGMSELALRESGLEDIKEHVRTIKQASSNLLVIINDILDFSKIETGKLEIVPVDYSVASLVNDVVSIIRMRLVDSAIRFTVNIDCNIPGSLIGDDKKISQALINVLGNAVKYTDKGFISFTAYPQFIDKDVVNLIVEIKDSGRGIKREDIDKMFDEFVQLGHEVNNFVEGVGLGLAITNSIVREMGGRISVESEFGKGSVFTLTFPQKFSKRDALATVENPESKNVLLYERRETYASSIVKTITNLGVNCVHIVSSRELFEKLAGRQFDFLFTSFHLFKQNEAIIMKHRDKTKIAVFTEFGENVTMPIPGNDMNVISMPVYSVPIASILGGVSSKFSYDAKDEPLVSFTAPDAKVLVVDDIITNLKVTQGLLAPYEMKVELCDSGFMALEKILSKDFDLVFMDHKMPEMDGVEAALNIRAMGDDDPYYTDIPIVALTANAVSGVKEMYFENGFDDFLSKPIDTVDLNTVLEKWIPDNKQVRLAAAANGASANKGGGTVIDGLNIKKGISMTGGTEELYKDVLASFCEDGYECIEKISKCLAEGNISLYVTYVHGIKSAAAVIGADEISKAALALETAGNSEDTAYIEANTAEFLQTLDTLLSDIRKWVNPSGNIP